MSSFKEWRDKMVGDRSTPVRRLLNKPSRVSSFRTFSPYYDPRTGKRIDGTAFSRGAVGNELGVSEDRLLVLFQSERLIDTPFRSKAGEKAYPPDLVDHYQVTLETIDPENTELDVYSVGLESGITVPMFRCAALACMLSLSPRVVMDWVADGTLPESPFQTAGGRPLYTFEMLDVAADLYEDIADLEDFRVCVQEEWGKQGVWETNQRTVRLSSDGRYSEILERIWKRCR